MNPLVLLSFDVEEFDTPLEYGQAIPEDEQMRVSVTGLEGVLALLDRLGVRATFFTTANFAKQHEAIVRGIAARHEVASHGYFHSTFRAEDLALSKAELERITGKPILGFRRARMAATDPAPIRAAGYQYNSSENPTWIPGRYNHFFAPRRPYLDGDLLNIPASVTPLVRFPLFWLSVKNFPAVVIRGASRWILSADGCLNLYFHPWEFADLRPYRLPRYIKRIDGAPMLSRLESYVAWLQRRADFITFGEFDARFRGVAQPPPAG